MPFDMPKSMMSFKRILSMSGGHGMGNKTSSMLFVVFLTICYIVDELFVVVLPPF